MHENAKCDCIRFKTVSGELTNAKQLNIETAFSILDAASQRNGEWITVLSMVYLKDSRTVYYCFNGNFNERLEYKFSVNN